MPSSEPTEIIAGLTQAWLYDGRIVAYTLTSASQQVVDAWIETALATVKVWQPEQPYLALHDFTHPAVTITPYARDRIKQVIPHLPPLARSASIISKNLYGQLIQIYVRITADRMSPNIERKIFFEREDGIKWLAEKLN